MVEAGCGTRIWGQTRCPVYRSGTFNVKRSALNFQLGDRKGAWWPGYGDRHDIWAAEFLTGWTWPSAGRAVQAGGAPRYRDRHAIWTTELFSRRTRPSAPVGRSRLPEHPDVGQTRCPICRSGTFNAQRSTVNFQLGERKGAWWAGYGDRHVIWAAGLLTWGTRASAGRTVEAGCGVQIWGQTRCSVYRSGTLNV